MPSAWDYIDIPGSIEKGRQIGATTWGRRQLQRGDYEGAAATVAPYNPQLAETWTALGEQRRAREQKREAEAFDREVTPLIARGDVAAATNLAVTRQRPSSTVVQLMELGRSMTNEKLTRARENAARTALQLRQMQGLTPEQRAAQYTALRTRLIAEDPTTAQHLPEAYDPQIATNLMLASVDAKEALDMIAQERKAEHARVRTLSPAEAAAAGFRSGSIVQQKPDGSYEVAQAPREPAAGFGSANIPSNMISAEREYAKEWRNVYNNFNDIQQQYHRLQTMGARGDSAGDLALVVSFTKMLDPGSVAREGEVALTQSTAGLLQQVQNLPNTWVQGRTLLTPTVRQALLAAGREMYGVYEKTYHDIANDYRGTAEQYGFDPDRVMMGYRPPGGGAPSPSAAAAPAAPAAAPAPPTRVFATMPPASEVPGSYVTNHTEKKTFYSNGSSWVEVPYRADAR